MALIVMVFSLGFYVILSNANVEEIKYYVIFGSRLFLPIKDSFTVLTISYLFWVQGNKAKTLNGQQADTNKTDKNLNLLLSGSSNDDQYIKRETTDEDYSKKSYKVYR